MLVPSVFLFLLLSHLSECLATTPLSFDYVIIGGGTAGLAVANRLSELPYITVAVIEAGNSVRGNANVTNIESFTRAYGTSIDWQYSSTNQTYAVGQQLTYHSGRALGGSSTINGRSNPPTVGARLTL